jgi:hypothetical protein
MTIAMRFLVFSVLMLALASVPACIELQLLLSGQYPQNGDGGSDNDNASNGNDNGGDEDPIPRVRLSVSNPAPQPNEEVNLTCEITAGDESNATFAFQPQAGQLIVNATAGTASFIVNEVDIGASLSFTCTATNEHGTSPPSNSVLIIATAAP